MGLTEIKITKIVTQYSTFEDGHAVCNKVREQLNQSEKVAISFEGIAGVPSSFVNGLLNDIIDEIGLNGIKQKIHFVNSTRIINDMLRSKFRLAAKQAH